MAKNKLPSKTAINKLLRQCGCDPRNDPVIKLIAESGNVDYYEEQARYLIAKAQENRKTDDGFAYMPHIIAAVRNLLLAVHYDAEENEGSA